MSTALDASASTTSEVYVSPSEGRADWDTDGDMKKRTQPGSDKQSLYPENMELQLPPSPDPEPLQPGADLPHPFLQPFHALHSDLLLMHSTDTLHNKIKSNVTVIPARFH